MTLIDIWKGNKNDAKTVGEFLTYAIDHIRNGGNYAFAESKLADGTPVKLSIERLSRLSDGSV